MKKDDAGLLKYRAVDSARYARKWANSHMQWKQDCKMLLLVYSSVFVIVASSSVFAQTESQKAAAMLFTQAVHLFEQGDFEGALERFDIGMRIDDKDSVAHYFLAQTYEQMGDRAKALEHYRLSAEYGPQTEYGIISKAVVEREDEKVKQQREQEQQAAQAAEQRSSQQQNQLSSTMVSVAGGCFEMGSPESEPERDSDERRHRVCVDDFRIGKYEVTQAEWEAVMGSNPSFFKGDRLPVETVSWNDVQEFLAKLNARGGRAFRLPTEAEWEYACRGGGREQRYCGGDDVDTLAWYSVNSGFTTNPVGGKRANGLGLYDMSGNVWEWTCSVYDGNYGGGETRCASQQDEGPRVNRGGSFYNRPANVRAAYRSGDDPANRNFNLGFRRAQDN